MPNTEAAQLAWIESIPRWPARLVARSTDGAGVGRLRIDVTSHPLRTSYRAHGQFVTLGPIAGAARFFAIARDPRADGIAEFLIAPGQEVADALLSLQPGQDVELSAAMGDGYAMDGVDGGDVVVVAAGTGIASVRPVLAAIVGGSLRPCSARLYYGVRRDGDWAFSEEFDAWRAAGVEVLAVASEGSGAGRELVTDRLQRDLDAMRGHDDAARAASAHYLVCGPDPMQRATVELLHGHGVPSGHIHFNY